ncbi:hypothetical protein H6P81_005396 [Aristolochia fimbriata]|uniref:Uncharacterized protein n=1 Tax=Aristolochia fimbriata TaxID=158543 RepID=A0AAV7EY45_ARIFI|nr:hypothetical protein H6P81_005396 [Aristolochia fimbriata]
MCLLFYCMLHATNKGAQSAENIYCISRYGIFLAAKNLMGKRFETGERGERGERGRERERQGQGFGRRYPSMGMRAEIYASVTKQRLLLMGGLDDSWRPQARGLALGSGYTVEWSGVVPSPRPWGMKRKKKEENGEEEKGLEGGGVNC